MKKLSSSSFLSQIPDFFQGTLSEKDKQSIYQQAESYLNKKTYNALTFETYQLQGTPSSILIDKKGMLRQVSFAAVKQLEEKIKALLKEEYCRK